MYAQSLCVPYSLCVNIFHRLGELTPSSSHVTAPLTLLTLRTQDLRFLVDTLVGNPSGTQGLDRLLPLRGGARTHLKAPAPMGPENIRQPASLAPITLTLTPCTLARAPPSASPSLLWLHPPQLQWLCIQACLARAPPTPATLPVTATALQREPMFMTRTSPTRMYPSQSSAIVQTPQWRAWSCRI